MTSEGKIVSQLELTPLGSADSHWRINDLRSGVECMVWPWTRDRPDLTDCIAERLPGRPWLLQLWEPIQTKAPSPAHCTPHCCYSRTVIFYHQPYIRGPKSISRWRDGKVHVSDGGFADYGQVETRLSWDDVVAFDGDHFKINGGRVVWRHQRWWMFRAARRVAQVVLLGEKE
ncbi:hypothetical protein LWE61_14885 [Sphingobium sufflavum]|uniref:hypothetical protein n=1 Tax=Sphingobium sufflavum TaxID=1129547 RepID=UPI001F16E24C|nr:hypothetical protein [Sphingobium sufflavum]MCE7797835.1 hypothetical protein [Sphingobium sufflavum]